MLPGLELAACSELAVPMDVMQHVVRVESAFNPYAIGVVGGRLVRQPGTLQEALSTVRMLEEKGYNFSLGLAQVNRYNLQRYGLDSYERAFQTCPNLLAGSKILAECYSRAKGDWGKSFSCYYSGNFVTGFRHGYVNKIYASINNGQGAGAAGRTGAIDVVGSDGRKVVSLSSYPMRSDGEVNIPKISDARPQRRSGSLVAPMVGSGGAREQAPRLASGQSVDRSISSDVINDNNLEVSKRVAAPASVSVSATKTVSQSTEEPSNTQAETIERREGRDSAFVF